MAVVQVRCKRAQGLAHCRMVLAGCRMVLGLGRSKMEMVQGHCSSGQEMEQGLSRMEMVQGHCNLGMVMAQGLSKMGLGLEHCNLGLEVGKTVRERCKKERVGCRQALGHCR